MTADATTVENTDFGRVAVLMGGRSAEREISLQSGHAVLSALNSRGVDAHAIDARENVVQQLLDGDFQRVFIVLHGRGGEDGTMQGLLEVLALPYTGSGVMASSLAMDKLKTKLVWRALGLPTPDFVILESAHDCESALVTLGLPLIVKPVLEGSSIGMSKVEAEHELEAAWQKARLCGGSIIAERWIEGNEYTAAILDDQVLPMIKLKTTHKFYDYDAKYEAADTQYICPCGLSAEQEAAYAGLIRQAFDAVGARCWGRVDFIVDQHEQPWLIEINTVPGMTSHSLVPMAAKEAGLSFDDLVLKVLRMASCENCR